MTVVTLSTASWIMVAISTQPALCFFFRRRDSDLDAPVKSTDALVAFFAKAASIPPLCLLPNPRRRLLAKSTLAP